MSDKHCAREALVPELSFVAILDSSEPTTPEHWTNVSRRQIRCPIDKCEVEFSFRISDSRGIYNVRRIGGLCFLHEKPEQLSLFDEMQEA